MWTQQLNDGEGYEMFAHHGNAHKYSTKRSSDAGTTKTMEFQASHLKASIASQLLEFAKIKFVDVTLFFE